MMSEREPARLLVRVYYEDTDFSGFVYHARYLHFMERARTEWLRDLGVDQVTLFSGRTGPPVALVVARMSIDFRAPARMDDILSIETEVLRRGGASLELMQRVLHADRLLCSAEVKIAATTQGRATRLPRCITAAITGAPRMTGQGRSEGHDGP